MAEDCSQQHMRTLLSGQLGQSLLKQKLEEQAGLDLVLCEHKRRGFAYISGMPLLTQTVIRVETHPTSLNNKTGYWRCSWTTDFVCLSQLFTGILKRECFQCLRERTHGLHLHAHFQMIIISLGVKVTGSIAPQLSLMKTLNQDSGVCGTI